MNNKKIGVILLGVSVVLLGIFLVMTQSLYKEAETLGCFANQDCLPIERSLSITHFAFGVFGFLFSLSFYLLFFNKGEQAIVKQLNTHKEQQSNEEKFHILLQGLDDAEQEVVKAVRAQSGITQNTLALRVDMSKAKLSQVLTQLEKKQLIKREKEKKTLAVYFTKKY